MRRAGRGRWGAGGGGGFGCGGEGTGGIEEGRALLFGERLDG